MLNLNGVNLIS